MLEHWFLIIYSLNSKLLLDIVDSFWYQNFWSPEIGVLFVFESVVVRSFLDFCQLLRLAVGCEFLIWPLVAILNQEKREVVFAEPTRLLLVGW